MSHIATAPEPTTARRVQTEHHHILIVGGGTAGITLGAKLARTLGGGSLGVVEPSGRHYYQPLWTLVGGGVVDKRKTERREDSLIPKGATWVRDAASEFVPEENELVTAGGRRIGYDFLVVAPGIQIDWDAIPGLAETIGGDSVSSIYSYEHVDRTWDLIRR
jgi:sulfide:quinone oxidoreductase